MNGVLVSGWIGSDGVSDKPGRFGCAQQQTARCLAEPPNRTPALRAPQEPIAGGTDIGKLADGTRITCRTVAGTGGIRPAADFEMALFDPRLQRTLEHRCCLAM